MTGRYRIADCPPVLTEHDAQEHGLNVHSLAWARTTRARSQTQKPVQRRPTLAEIMDDRTPDGGAAA